MNKWRLLFFQMAFLGMSFCANDQFKPSLITASLALGAIGYSIKEDAR